MPLTVEGFAPVANAQVEQATRITPDQLVRLVASWSPVAVRPDLEEVLAAVHELGLRVATAGALEFGYIEDCYRFTRT